MIFFIFLHSVASQYKSSSTFGELVIQEDSLAWLSSFVARALKLVLKYLSLNSHSEDIGGNIHWKVYVMWKIPIHHLTHVVSHKWGTMCTYRPTFLGNSRTCVSLLSSFHSTNFFSLPDLTFQNFRILKSGDRRDYVVSKWHSVRSQGLELRKGPLGCFLLPLLLFLKSYRTQINLWKVFLSVF